VEVRDVEIVASPLSKEHVRLQATVRYDGRSRERELYWFDVPSAVVDDVSRSGNPWFACLLPLAAQSGETLRVALPVDRPLVANAPQLMRIWRAWYPHLSVVDVEVDVATSRPNNEPRRAAAFFSGGVDSFFTALRDREVAVPGEREPIRELMTVWGFDVPLSQPEAFARLRVKYASAASELGMGFVDVATNIRSTRWHEAQWSLLAHGAGLASTALTLEHRYHTVYIAGSGSYRDIHPWGSHAVTDPLLSTSRTSIVFDGAAYLRIHKIERIAANPTVLRHLRVCFESETDENCGVCHKCLRTMLALDLYGVLAKSETLPTRLDLERIATMDCSHPFTWREFEDLRAVAQARGRGDVVAALERSMRLTRVRRAMRAVAEPLRRVWRRARAVRQR
jgi:hypothetical protein